jgi:hypothetical protein
MYYWSTLEASNAIMNKNAMDDEQCKKQNDRRENGDYRGV